MKREYHYHAVVIIEDGHVIDHWAETDDGRAIVSSGAGPEFVFDALFRYRETEQCAAEDAADAKREEMETRT